MAVNRAKLVETATVDFLRAARRIHAQNKEVALAQGASDRASARLAAAEDKVRKYATDQAEALEVLEMLKAEVPVYEAPADEEEDGADSEESVEDVETEDSEDDTEEDVESEEDENSDVLV